MTISQQYHETPIIVLSVLGEVPNGVIRSRETEITRRVALWEVPCAPVH
jgi:hypothetical protein